MWRYDKIWRYDKTSSASEYFHFLFSTFFWECHLCPCKWGQAGRVICLNRCFAFGSREILQLYLGHNHHNGPQLPPSLNESTAMYLQGYRRRLLFPILQDVSVLPSNCWWGSWFYSSLPDHLAPCCCFSITFSFLSKSPENAVPSSPPFWYTPLFPRREVEVPHILLDMTTGLTPGNIKAGTYLSVTRRWRWHALTVTDEYSYFHFNFVRWWLSQVKWFFFVTPFDE